MAKIGPKRGFPWGCPTKTCGSCNGSGMSQSKYRRELEARNPQENLVERVVCSECRGSGRVITDDSSIRKCRHNVLLKDCAACRSRADAQELRPHG